MLAVIVGLFASVQVAAAQRASGVVVSNADGVVTLDDGSSFSVDNATRVTTARAATVDDLQAGEYAAITAVRMDDGTLLASMVVVFPESSRGSNERQFEMGDGNLMTNATIGEMTIDEVVGGFLMVTFQGQMDHVLVPANAQVVVRTDASVSDIQPGVTISANVTDGVASSITLGA